MKLKIKIKYRLTLQSPMPSVHQPLGCSTPGPMSMSFSPRHRPLGQRATLAHWVQKIWLEQRAETCSCPHSVKINSLERSPMGNTWHLFARKHKQGQLETEKCGLVRTWSKPAGQAGWLQRRETRGQRLPGWARRVQRHHWAAFPSGGGCPRECGLGHK